MGALGQGTRFKSIYRVSDAQPNWAQTDPSQPDYIRNKDLAQEVRPIYINGQPFLTNDPETGVLNLVAGNNVILTTKDNNVIIQAIGGGGGEGPSATYLEGEGIDIIQNEFGQFVINLEKNSIDDEFIESISIEKIVQKENEVLILNGGKANGNY